MSDLLPDIIPDPTREPEPEPEPEPDAAPSITAVIEEVREPEPARERRDEVDELPVVEPDEVDEPPSVKPIIDDDVIFKDPPKKPKKARSDKQMAHLKKAREKALATRRANKAARDEAAGKSVKKVKSTPKAPSPEPDPEELAEELSSKMNIPSSMRLLSLDDIKELQQQAIEGYDTKRKKRKDIKRKGVATAKQESKTYEAVAKAIHQPSNPDPDDVWSLCFQ